MRCFNLGHADAELSGFTLSGVTWDRDNSSLDRKYKGCAIYVADGARLETSPLPHPWNWPLDAPVKLAVADASGAPLALVPYGCTKLRASLFPCAAECDAILSKFGNLV